MKYIKQINIDDKNLSLLELDNNSKEIDFIYIEYSKDFFKKLKDDKFLLFIKNQIENIIDKHKFKDKYSSIQILLEEIAKLMINKDNIFKSFSKKEKNIYFFSNPRTTLLYIRKYGLKKDEIEQVENSLKNNPELAIEYAIDFLNAERFLEAEPEILKNFSIKLINKYLNKVIKGRWIELEEKYISKKDFNYLINYIKDNINYFTQQDIENFKQIIFEENFIDLIVKFESEIENKGFEYFKNDLEKLHYYVIINKNSPLSKEKRLDLEKSEKIINKYPELILHQILNSSNIAGDEFDANLEKILKDEYWSYVYLIKNKKVISHYGGIEGPMFTKVYGKIKNKKYQDSILDAYNPQNHINNFIFEPSIIPPEKVSKKEILTSKTSNRYRFFL